MKEGMNILKHAVPRYLVEFERRECSCRRRIQEAYRGEAQARIYEREAREWCSS